MATAAKKTSKEKEKKRERLVLLDSHAILHRAYHALPDFSSAKGEPTGALYGLSTMLLKIIGELQPDYLVAAYDLPEPTYRHEAFEDYKLGRAELEDELIAQIERSRDVFKAFGIPIYEAGGFEADDILGTIVEQVTKNPPAGGLDVIIASGDMDTLQLVDDERVRVYTLRKGIQDTILYDEKAVNERFGFGPELLPDYKGLRGDPSDNIPGISGIGEKTATSLITAFGGIEDIYKKLKKDKEAFEKAGIKPRIVGLLEEGEEEAQFSKMLATIRRDAPITFSLPKERFKDALDEQKVLDLYDELSFRALADRIRQLFGGKEEKNSDEEEDESVDEQEVRRTAIALWLVRSDITSPKLDDILQFAKTKSFSQAREKVFNELKERDLEKVFKKIEEPLIPIVERMEEVGIKIDRAYLEKLSKTYHKELEKYEKKIYKHAGREFNINSPKQLGEVLFDELELSPKNHKRTGTGQRSTRESELEKLAGEHPIIEEILSYRELQKLLSTYIDNIPELLDKENRLHATFLQAGTTTGRMASQQPNLQNIPIRTELGRNIREAFVASEGFKLVAFDYSQIELRVAAFLSGDEKLIKVFKEGGDIHQAVAAEVFDVAPDEVDREQRRRAKVINFGILYGMGVNALKSNLGTDRKEAQAFLNKYFERFEGLAEYIDRIKAEAARVGYTTTLFGRRRYFNDISSSVPYIRAAAERMAVNAPIQGTEADIIKLAMVEVDRFLEKEGKRGDARLLLQVHDELVYEVSEGEVDALVPKIRELMESVVPDGDRVGVPLSVEVKTGGHWGEVEPYRGEG